MSLHQGNPLKPIFKNHNISNDCSLIREKQFWGSVILKRRYQHSTGTHGFREISRLDSDGFFQPDFIVNFSFYNKEKVGHKNKSVPP